MLDNNLYYTSKYDLLQTIKNLILKERQAINDADMVSLHKIMEEVENNQSRLEKLDREYLTGTSFTLLTDIEMQTVAKLQKEIAALEYENIQLLIKQREVVITEIRDVNTKRNANKAYMPAQKKQVLLNRSL